MTRHRALEVFTWLFTAAVLVAIPVAAITAEWGVLGTVVGLQALVFSRLREPMNAILSAKDTSQSSHFVADALSHRTSDLAVVAGLLRHLEPQPFRCSRLAALGGSLTADGVPASRIIRGLQRLSEIHDSLKNAALFPLALILSGRISLALAGLSAAAVLQLVRPHIALAVGAMADATWRRRARVDRGGGAIRGVQFAVRLSVRAPRGSLPGARAGRSRDARPGAVRGNPARAPAVASCHDGPQRRPPGRRSAAPRRQRLEHVREEHAACERWGSTRFWRWPAHRCEPPRCGSRRWRSAARSGSRTRCRRGAPASTRRSRGSGSSSTSRPVPRRSCSCSTSSFTAPTRTIGFRARPASCEAFWIAGPSGLITTHDLALTSVADELSPRAANVHFEDWFEEGDMKFDYRMKPGPVTRSNALALMRAVGLDVPSETYRSG